MGSVYFGNLDMPFTSCAFDKLCELVHLGGFKPQFALLAHDPDARHEELMVYGENAQKMADAIDNILPDVPDHDCRPLTPARAVGIDSQLGGNVLHFWSGQRERLRAIRDYCREGSFTVFIDD
jgi:hypothetical protein